MADPSANGRGIALMLCAMGGYAFNDTLVKLATYHLPSGQVLVVRGLFAVLLLLAISGASGDIRHWRSLRQLGVAQRCLWEVAAAVTSVLALSIAPQATVTAIMMASPLLIAMGTWVLGWEAPSARRTLAALIGLGGVLLIVRPGLGASELMGGGFFYAILCAVSLAGRDLATQSIPRDVPSSMIATASTVATGAVGTVMCLAQGWAPLRPAQAGLLALAAACAALGGWALVAACRVAALSIVAPFRFSIVLWAALLGYLLAGEKPDVLAAIGISSICAGGWMLKRSEKAK